MSLPAHILSRLGPVVPGLANRPGGVWTVTAYGLHTDGRTDNTAALSRLAQRAAAANAALLFPPGVYWIADWRLLGWLSAGQRVMTSQRWIGQPGSILRTGQGLELDKVYWHGLWASGLTFQAPNAPGEKLFGGGSRNLFFHQCTVQNCAPDFLDGPDEWVTLYECLFNATADYVRTTVDGYGPCTPQIQQTIGNVGQHFTVDSCSFQFTPHGQSGSLISLEGSGLIGDYVINANHILTDNQPDYLVDAAIDVEPHQRDPIADVTITNNYIWNGRIYIAGVTRALIANNTIHMGRVGQAPAPFPAPYCGNTNTIAGRRWQDRGKTRFPALGQAIIGWNSYGNLADGKPNPDVPNPPAGTITIQDNIITYADVAITSAPPVPVWFQQGGQIAALTIQGNHVVQNARAVTVTLGGNTIPPVLCYLSPGTTPGGWGTVSITGNTWHRGTATKAALVQLNLAPGRSLSQFTLTSNVVTGSNSTLTAGVAVNILAGGVAQPGITVNGNSPAAANQVAHTGYSFGGGPTTAPATPWFENRALWAAAGVLGAGGYGAWAWQARRWPFG